MTWQASLSQRFVRLAVRLLKSGCERIRAS